MEAVRSAISLARTFTKPVQDAAKKAQCFAMTLWCTGFLLAAGCVVALIAATRAHGLFFILALVVACSSCCGASVLCWGSSQVIAYTASIRAMTSQADRAEQIISYVEGAHQQYQQVTGATLNAEMKDPETKGALSNV